MSCPSVRVHHLVGWYSHSLIFHKDIHSHRSALLNTHLLIGLSLSMPPSPTHFPVCGFVTTVAGHVRMAYLADNSTRIALPVTVWIMTACGSAAKVCQVSATRGSRSSRYAMQSDMAAVKAGRPEAGVLDTYPFSLQHSPTCFGQPSSTFLRRDARPILGARSRCPMCTTGPVTLSLQVDHAE